MYNILLIDDEPIISEIITDILCIYLQKNEAEFKIHTATNGQEAVEVCKNSNIDLAFMDINMPVMDGIEATQKIKMYSPKTMIIALTCVDDEGKQREMLNAGAEDYVHKPISSVIFKSRLKNYLSILDSRLHIDFIASAKNLFSSKIYNHSIIFSISNEEHLAEFWESILIRMNLLKEIDHSSDLVRLIYNIGTLYLHSSYRFDIIIEEDEQRYYFTLSNANLIPRNLLEKLVEKNFPPVRHILSDNKFSLLLDKNLSIPDETIQAPLENKISLENSVSLENEVSIGNEVSLEGITSLEKEQYSTYDFLESDDIDEFEDSLYKLHTIMGNLGQNECSLGEIQTINSYFYEMKKVLIQASESYVIATAIEELSTSISKHSQEFIQMAKDIQPIALGFIDDLILWKEMTFYEGAPSVDFMNDSILANAKIMQDLLNPQEASEEELDDIFAF